MGDDVGGFIVGFLIAAFLSCIIWGAATEHYYCVHQNIKTDAMWVEVEGKAYSLVPVIGAQ